MAADGHQAARDRNRRVRNQATGASRSLRSASSWRVRIPGIRVGAGNIFSTGEMLCAVATDSGCAVVLVMTRTFVSSLELSASDMSCGGVAMGNSPSPTNKVPTADSWIRMYRLVRRALPFPGREEFAGSLNGR